MTYFDFMTDTRRKLSEGFGAFCESKGLDALTVMDSQFDIEKKPLSLCAYPPADGSTFQTDGRHDTVRFVVAMHCNKSATAKGVLQAEKYFSAAAQYITQTCFGEASQLEDSALCLMSNGEPLNGAWFLITARIHTRSDYDEWA